MEGFCQHDMEVQRLNLVERLYREVQETNAELRVRDNGAGIAAAVARRVGGDLQVNTVFGDYAEFLMTLPAKDAEMTETASESATALLSGA